MINCGLVDFKRQFQLIVKSGHTLGGGLPIHTAVGPRQKEGWRQCDLPINHELTVVVTNLSKIHYLKKKKLSPRTDIRFYSFVHNLDKNITDIQRDEYIYTDMK